MKRICPYCGKIVDTKTHVCTNKPKDVRRNRKAPINNQRWNKIRDEVRARDGCCVLCYHNGIFRKGEEVHHIMPMDIDQSDENVFNVNNCVFLCRDCHHEVHNEGWKNYIDLFRRLVNHD